MRTETVTGTKTATVTKKAKEEIKMRPVMTRTTKKTRVIDRNIDSHKCSDSEVLGTVTLTVTKRDSNNEDLCQRDCCNVSDSARDSDSDSDKNRDRHGQKSSIGTLILL